MSTSANARESILGKIAKTRITKSFEITTSKFNSNEIFQPIETEDIVCFKNELGMVNGECIYCENEDKLFLKLQNYIEQNNLKHIFCKDPNIVKSAEKYGIQLETKNENFNNMEAGITSCECLVARTGTVVCSSAVNGRRMNIFPPLHIIIANSNQLVENLSDAIGILKNKYGTNLPSSVSFITGPSRTADIEKTLVMGAHGPKHLVVFINNNNF